MSPEPQEAPVYAYSVNDLAVMGLRLGHPDGAVVVPDELLVRRGRAAFRTWDEKGYLNTGIDSFVDRKDAIGDFLYNLRVNDELQPFSAIRAAASLIVTNDDLLSDLDEEELRQVLRNAVFAELVADKKLDPSSPLRSYQLAAVRLTFMAGEINSDQLEQLIPEILSHYAPEDSETVREILEFGRKIDEPQSPTAPQFKK